MSARINTRDDIMEVFEKKYTVRSVVRTVIYTLGFNSVIAFILTVVGYGGGFDVNLIFSQFIGLSICGSVLATIHFGRVTHPKLKWMLLGAALLFGAIVGTIAGAIATQNWRHLFSGTYGNLFGIMVISVLFGIAVTYFFISREQIARSKSSIQEERIQRLTIEKRMAETRLKLLQAQIEPHFLYNTLSNILSLMETDGDKAWAMLSDLIKYLRTSLAMARETATTIGQEMAVVRAYINIFKLRMGNRLTYRIEIPDDIATQPLPPMLIQPLVENAILHGIDPLVEGGKVIVSAKKCADKLKVRVTDNGSGMNTKESRNAGIGLTNIRERLKALYGQRACLRLEDSQPSGLTAIIEVPLETV